MVHATILTLDQRVHVYETFAARVKLSDPLDTYEFPDEHIGQHLIHETLERLYRLKIDHNNAVKLIIDELREPPSASELDLLVRNYDRKYLSGADPTQIRRYRAQVVSDYIDALLSLAKDPKDKRYLEIIELKQKLKMDHELDMHPRLTYATIPTQSFPLLPGPKTKFG